MLSIIIDFETTGLDVSTARVIEVGAMVVDESWDTVATLSCLVNSPDVPPLSEEIQKLTGITQKELTTNGMDIIDAFGKLGELVDPEVGCVIAYNKAYDEAIFRSEILRWPMLGMIAGINWMRQLPWVCAMTDLEDNYQYKCWKLSHLALDKGVAIDPKNLHRAINDVELTRKMLKQSGANLQSMLDFATSPWLTVSAMIPGPWEDGGKGRDKAKELGYSWEVAKGTTEPKFEKCWVKRIKENKYDDEAKAAPFKVNIIK